MLFQLLFQLKEASIKGAFIEKGRNLRRLGSSINKNSSYRVKPPAILPEHA
jgi:hypothetical protein